MSTRLPTQEPPARPRRRADRPTAPAAARASIRAAGRALRLLATEPRRRRAQRGARVELGRAVAASLAGQPAPPPLATPLAAHRAAQLRLASTDPPPRPSPRPTGSAAADGDQAPGGYRAPGGDRSPGSERAPQPSGTGAVAESRAPRPQAQSRVTARAGRSARRDRDGVASRAGRSAGREADLAAELERLLLIVVQFLPRLAARLRLRKADERLGAWATGLSDPQDPVVAAARERASAAQRAATAARAAASANWRQAVDAARLSLRLVSEATADLLGWAAHGLRSGSSMLVAWLVSLAVAGRRRLRHGSAAAGRHVRAGSAATREGLRAGSTAAGQGLRGAGRGVRGAGAGIAGAAGGLASRIDALADRGGAARGGNGSEAPPAEALAATQEFDGARNGHSDGAGRGRLVLDPADPVEAWWLPSGMADPVSIADPVSMADPV